MTIAIDIDDTLANFSSVFITYYNKFKKNNLDIVDFRSHDWWRTIGLDRGDVVSTIYDFYNSEDFLQIQPIAGSIEIVEKLSKKYKLICVSARAKEIKEETKLWIKKYFADYITDVFVTDLHLFNGGKRNKFVICQEQEVELLIDDLPKFAEECTKNGIKTLLFDQPWNQSIKNSIYLERVKSWAEIGDILL